MPAPSLPTDNDIGLPRHFIGGQLRRLRPDDLADFQAYRTLPELGRYQGWSAMPDADAAAFLDEMRRAPLFVPGEWVQLGIAEPDGARLVGDMGLFISADGRCAELGFTLAPGAQGRGIATEAVRAAARLLFALTQVDQVLGITDSRNGASLRLLQRAGFRLRERQEAVFRGEPCVEEVYTLSRPDTSTTLSTPRLKLEPLVVAHAAEMFAVLSDPAIYEFENAPPDSEAALAARYARLERRRSPEGHQAWLNWAVRLPGGALAGYVQATVLPDGIALVAYELGSRHWRQGIGSAAVTAVLDELRRVHAVGIFAAVLKTKNHRSLGLLRKLGFAPAPPTFAIRLRPEADETVMLRPAGAGP